MPVVRAKDAPTFDLDGLHFHGLTSPSRGATELCTWRLGVAAGAESEAHHIDREEVFIVLDGSISIVTTAEEFELHAGDAISIPAQTQFRLKNASQENAQLVVCLPVGAHGTMADGREVGTPPWAR
ncbi:cupin [Reticulibacter mediterranei]|uniref:Cupin n=1 Tax=Reticulibacter mediterranei TaxID=2778369 RepID=A0A8J3IW37_9CHLR|nr:cupin domain-containing protein [Reticulibacter mediterranei]GHO97887.1 cupin [Reticulibacter mediterranei]